MIVKTPSWRTLNAYVDGELEAADAAAVAQVAGLDAATAQQISLLYHVKGSIYAAAPQPPADLAEVMPALPPRRSPWMLALALAAAIAGLTLLVVQPWHYVMPTANDELFATAQSLHRQWLADEMANTVDSPPVVLAALSRFGHLPVVPDLESTGLSVVLVSISENLGRRILQIGYRGQHGCHLSLFVFDGNVVPKAGDASRDENERAYAWRAADLSYLLFARGMDGGRFTLISQKVEQATRLNAPLDTLAKQQLAENKRNSTSCQS
jgi:hypothetical protein